jgi:hypothetical protein|tara:strand:- start:255 stop:488 length:234 start_codon:yes stop_codon:yes gene_type:complete
MASLLRGNPRKVDKNATDDTFAHDVWTGLWFAIVGGAVIIFGFVMLSNLYGTQRYDSPIENKQFIPITWIADGGNKS